MRAVPLAALALGAALAVGFSSAERAGLPGAPKDVAGYKSWFKINARPIPPSSASAHFGRKNIYATKKRVGGRYPYGSILVKEGVEPGTDFVGLIAIMRKARGSDRKHGDWRWVEYSRAGAAASFQEIGSGAVCWTCHMGARKTDWVWTTR